MCFVLQRHVIFFFISLWSDNSAQAALPSLLFDAPEPQIIGKIQYFATFRPFRASVFSFFWLFLFSDLLSSTLLFPLPLPISTFHLSTLSEIWLLNFLWSKVGWGGFGSRAMYISILISCFPTLLFFKIIIRQDYSGKLVKAIPQSDSRSYFPKLFPCKTNTPKRLCFKPVPQNGSPKLFSKAGPKSCSPKWLPKAAPQSCILS